MASVYLGRDPSGRQVAVKLIRPDLAADEGFRKRFELEAVWVRRVRQAYIAPVLDFGDHQGRPFLVTEYIEGPPLKQAVRERGPMPGYEVEQLGEQVASALVAVHAVKLVHRDLKPSNVILGRTGPRVIDFGIAHALDDSGGLTSQNVRLGTRRTLSTVVSCCWAPLAYRMAHRQSRPRLPLIIYAAVALVAWSSTSISRSFYGLWQLSGPDRRAQSRGRLNVLWNLLDSIPLIDIDSMLDWERPIDEFGANLGWLLPTE